MPLNAPALHKVRVWDLPTRLFHWVLVLALIGLVVSGKLGGNAIVWHMRLGLLVGTLLLFRLLWGVVGGRWSRFASFLVSPAGLQRYLRGQPQPGDWFQVGHNPLGAWSVVAMLCVLLVQVATGLLVDDEIATTGPLNRFVSSATGLAATGWHKGWGPWLIFGLVGLHVLAIIAHALRGERLVPPMLHGDKLLTEPAPAAEDGWASRLKALLLLLACGALALWVASPGA